MVTIQMRFTKNIDLFSLYIVKISNERVEKWVNLVKGKINSCSSSKNINPLNIVKNLRGWKTYITNLKILFWNYVQRK